MHSCNVFINDIMTSPRLSSLLFPLLPLSFFVGTGEEAGVLAPRPDEVPPGRHRMHASRAGPQASKIEEGPPPPQYHRRTRSLRDVLRRVVTGVP